VVTSDSRRSVLVCATSLLTSLTIYGGTESYYMSRVHHEVLAYVLYNAAFLLPTAVPLILLDGNIAVKAYRCACYSCYLMFLAFYGASVTFVNSPAHLTIPNPFPQLLVRYGDVIEITVYHLLLFVFGFLALVASYSLLIDGGHLLARLVALYGTLLVGLVYQDWFWFLLTPNSVFTCGSLYGVYFTWWVRVGCVCVPGMYLALATTGLLLFAVALGSVLRGRDLILAVTHLLGLMALLLAIGLIITWVRSA